MEEIEPLTCMKLGRGRGFTRQPAGREGDWAKVLPLLSQKTEGCRVLTLNHSKFRRRHLIIFEREEEAMKPRTKSLLIMIVGFALMMGATCAPTMVSISDPKIQTAANPYYQAQFEPLTRDHNFFAVFHLTVTNKSNKDLQIDWNKTRYLYNGKPYGVFVFKGIEPKDIKNWTIPPDVIRPEATFSKEIAPYKLLARAPIRERKVGTDEPAIHPGPIPAGKSGILLVVRQAGKEIVEKMTVTIREKEVR